MTHYHPILRSVDLQTSHGAVSRRKHFIFDALKNKTANVRTT
jgi:hypothetical protein